MAEHMPGEIEPTKWRMIPTEGDQAVHIQLSRGRAVTVVWPDRLEQGEWIIVGNFLDLTKKLMQHTIPLDGVDDEIPF